jgi:glycosyltransferase involved in cell wall biosynthesis
MRICLVGVGSEGLLGGSFGGSEKQIALLGRHLAMRSHEVTFVATQYYGHDLCVDGVMLRAAWDPEKGLRWLRVPAYRLPTLERTLRAIDADVYYVRGAVLFSPLVMKVGRAVGSPVLLGLASDRDLYPDSGRVLFGLGTSISHRAMGYTAWAGIQRRALRLADVVVVQNSAQAAVCAQRGLRHALIPSIVEEPPQELTLLDPQYDIVWVGNVQGEGRRSKGVDQLVRLARVLPQVRFAVIGALTSASVREAVAELVQLANVDYLGALDHGDAQRCIARSRVVINTSPAEGFSNVMLEGWALGKPAVTLSVNPSGLLHEEGLGRCAGGDPDLLASLLREVLMDGTWLDAAGRRARDYVRKVHAAAVVCGRYEHLIASVRSHVSPGPRDGGV